MQSVVATASLVGIEGVPVEVQADVTSGLPLFGIVGLPDVAVQEARDRVRSAIRSSGYEFPNARVIVNLAPAPLRKHGTGFDLPIALAILCATRQLPSEALSRVAAVGELGLDGTLRAVPGMLSHALAATSADRDLLGPGSAASAVAAVPALRYRCLESIAQLRQGLPECAVAPQQHAAVATGPAVDLADISGHESAKRAVEIAAAGGHNMLMIGPPGSGKTLLARALCGVLPTLNEAERLEAALVHSVAGRDVGCILAGQRPFRAPHHSCSIAGLVGGGTPPVPGEISLAHSGVLFLDELPEFGPRALQSLRQPLEEGVVTLVRAGGAVRYPARFTLVSAMNPCPCGYGGDPARACSCAPSAVARYLARVGGPLLDRMDIALRVDRIDPALLLEGAQNAGTSAAARKRIGEARRFADSRPVLTPASLEPDARSLLESSARRAQLSGRAVTRVLRVARTIADLDAADRLGVAHVAEALAYRAWEPR